MHSPANYHDYTEPTGTTDGVMTPPQDDSEDLQQIDDMTVYKLTRELQDNEANKRSLIGSKLPLSVLANEYVDPSFKNKIESMASNGLYYRPIRGDGNCAWRAVLYGLLDLIGSNKEQCQLMKSLLQNYHTMILDEAGFEKIAYEDFIDSFYEILDSLIAQGPQYIESNSFLENTELQNGSIVCLRFITSAYIKTHSDSYEPFLEGESIDSYCARNIEAFSVEADHLSLAALVSALAVVSLHISYIDGSNTESETIHILNPDYYVDQTDFGSIKLLYRPGHYDLLLDP
ncbi:hypothetical protein CANCADRAFT_2453 [Tortispora caseinolytica NRRL Y-17796]|uniref:ubiquitinyl hydrolase 1 n=1 Tax=Tortispora caseinolytica NRRL Y-17796 TaxID=767744 RepID=A0A1E4TG31_9ASCO|nr:hypothetical protein CANCADRAFT_2453 [Tortispora caseinolytica NRRL Y-17796]